MFFVAFLEFPNSNTISFGTTETILAKIWLVKFAYVLVHFLSRISLTAEEMESMKVYRQCFPRAMEIWKNTETIHFLLCVPSTTIHVVRSSDSEHTSVAFRLRSKLAKWDFVLGTNFVFISRRLKLLGKHCLQRNRKTRTKKFSNVDLIKNSNVRFAWNIDK